MYKKLALVTTIGLSLASVSNVAMASYDSDEESAQGSGFSPFRNISPEEVNTQAPQQIAQPPEHVELERQVDQMGGEVRSFAMRVFEWRKNKTEEMLEFKSRRKAFKQNPSPATAEAVRQQYPQVLDSLERQKKEFEDELVHLNFERLASSFKEHGCLINAEKIYAIIADLKLNINNAHKNIMSGFKRKISSLDHELTELTRPPLTPEQKMAQARRAEMIEKAMKPHLQRLKELHGRIFGENSLENMFASFEQPEQETMTFHEARAFLSVYPAELEKNRATFMAAQKRFGEADLLFDNLSRMINSDSSYKSVEVLQRALSELEIEMDALINGLAISLDLNDKAVIALKKLGQLTLAEKVIEETCELRKAQDILKQKQIKLDRCKEGFKALKERIEQSQTSSSDSEDDDSASLETYSQRMTRCAQGELPAEDASLSDFVAYIGYRVNSLSAETVSLHFTEEALDKLKQNMLKYLENTFFILFQALAVSDRDMLIDGAERNAIPVIQSLAALFKLEITSDDPAHLKKLMRIVIKKINSMTAEGVKE